jgi:hypothetical protein
MTVEDFMRSMRQLGDYCDVGLDLGTLDIAYNPDGEALGSIEGDMIDTQENWDRLKDSIKDITGFEIDYEGMIMEAIVDFDDEEEEE